MADISRSEVATLIQEAYADTLLASAKEGSTVLPAFPTPCTRTSSMTRPCRC